MGLGEVPDAWGPSVVTIGVFDGVHRGHQRIVARAAAAARDLRLSLVVVTFDPHPAEVIRPGSHPAQLCTLLSRENSGVNSVRTPSACSSSPPSSPG